MGRMNNAQQTVAETLSRAADYLAARYRIVEAKTIGQIVTGYFNRLTSIVKATFKNGDAVSMRQQHKALLKNAARDVYRDGYREGGIDPQELEPDDRANYDEAIDDWIAGQFEFVNQFAKDAAAAKRDKEAQAAILMRVEQWAASLQNFGEAGRLAALGNIPLTFDGDDGFESCEDCQRYKGQRHRRDWWAKRGLLERNGNPNYECGRWENCHHDFRDDNGKVVVS